MMQCQPVKIHLRKTGTEKSIYGLFHRDMITDISKELEFDAITRTAAITGSIQLSAPYLDKNDCRNYEQKNKLINVKIIEEHIFDSCTPNLFNTLGQYEEVDDTIIKLINTDFWLKPEKLYLVAELFRGAIAYDKLCLLLIARGVYSRHTSIDIHAESDIDFVPSSKCFYNRLSCSIFITSGGKKKSMKKLIIGSNTINLLITYSVTLSSKTPTVFVGPQINEDPSTFSTEYTKTFLQNSKIHNFKKVMEHMNQLDESRNTISCLRQLNSHFAHHSTYSPLRAILSDFNDSRLTPATIFILCDLPDNDGYGSSCTSAPKMGSLLLQKFAIAINVKRDLKRENVRQFMSLYKVCSITEESDSWKPIVEVVAEIESQFSRSETIETMPFIKNHNLTKIADIVGGKLKVANDRISTNVGARLLRLYG